MVASAFVDLDEDVGRVLGAHLFEQSGGIGARKVLEQIRRHFGLQLDEDVGSLGRFEAADQIAEGFLVEFLEDGGGRPGGRLRQGLPLLTVGIEIFLDRLGLAARLDQ